MTPQDPVSRAVTAYYAALECSPPCGAHEAMEKALAEYEAAQWRPWNQIPDGKELVRYDECKCVFEPGNRRWRPLPPPPEAA